MKHLVLAMAACLMMAPEMALAQTTDAEAHYQELLAAAKAATGPVDWKALRYAYADRPDFTGTPDEEDREAMFKAADGNDWPGVQAAAQRAVDQMYVDGAAHLMMAIAYDHMGKADDAQREGTIGEGLLDSIQTGDGLSYDTAWTVITVAEEYDYLTYAGLEPGNQSLEEHDGHEFDVLEAKDDKGSSAKYYFNIDREWAAENRLFSGLELDGDKKP
jgi:hypothetical protein